MKKKICITFFFSIILLSKNYAQNIVPNNKFERVDTSICPPPSYASIVADSPPWIEYGTANYFNHCDTSNYLSTPQNVIGYQTPRSGVGYVGLYSYYSTVFSREYIEVQLTTPLIASQTYHVQFFVSLGDTMQYAIENMGALFTDTLYDPYPSSVWTPGIPQIENNPGNMLNDKMNWMAVTDSFVATGGEQYITIGNFYDDASTIKQYFGGTTTNTLGAYYYIDDIYVGTTPPPVGIHEIAKDEMNFRLYPNPSNGNITLEYDLKEYEKADLNIYDLIGKLVAKYNLPNGTKSLAVDAHSLNSGTYVYEIVINGRATKRDKLTIIK